MAPQPQPSIITTLAPRDDDFTKHRRLQPARLQCYFPSSNKSQICETCAVHHHRRIGFDTPRNQADDPTSLGRDHGTVLINTCGIQRAHISPTSQHNPLFTCSSACVPFKSTLRPSPRHDNNLRCIDLNQQINPSSANPQDRVGLSWMANLNDKFTT